MNPKLSIIIPTYNEAMALPLTLKQLETFSRESIEVIVVDGGSKDETLELAAPFEVKILNSKKLGRAAQLNFGARSALGDHLCFLHADTQVPDNLAYIIDNVLSDDKVVLAGFVSVMRGASNRWFISFLNYTKTYFCPLIYRPYHFLFKGLRLLFGDQVMFCRKGRLPKSWWLQP